LPLEIASFVEVSIGDHTIAGYEGLHCVERSHIIDVKLKPLLGSDVMNKIGLPMHTDFYCSDPRNSTAKGDDSKHFAWFSCAECEASGIKMTDYGLTTVMDLTSLDGTTTCREKLKAFLTHAGVDIETPAWQEEKRHGSSKLDDLAKELSLGKCSLVQSPAGVYRCVNVVSVRCWTPDRQHMLIEKGRKYKSGEEEWDARLPGTKQDANESLMDVVMRVCEEHFNISDKDLWFSQEGTWEHFEYRDTSSRYKGLLTKYQKFFVDVAVEDEESDFEERLGLVLNLPQEQLDVIPEDSEGQSSLSTDEYTYAKRRGARCASKEGVSEMSRHASEESTY